MFFEKQLSSPFLHGWLTHVISTSKINRKRLSLWDLRKNRSIRKLIHELVQQLSFLVKTEVQRIDLGRWMWRKAILFYSDKSDPPNKHISHPQMSTYLFHILICPRKITLPMKCFIINHIKRDNGHMGLSSRGQNTCSIKKRWKAQYGKQISFN